MAKWENHFNKLQHGLTFDENNPDVTDTFENDNCNKKLIQNDVGSSQNKSYDKHKIHSLDECAKNMVEKLQAVPKHLKIDKKKRWTFNPNHKNFPTRHLIRQNYKQNAKAFVCAATKTFGIQKKNVIELAVWKKCDHCKRHYELYLNYNSENNPSSWADMMEKDLKWNKQQNLDDENQEATHNIES